MIGFNKSTTVPDTSCINDVFNVVSKLNGRGGRRRDCSHRRPVE